ncbi:MAG: hypothetical protein QM757_08365 [Paludibaculum sp.]
MDYLSNMANNLGYALAVEKLLGIEIPPKAQWMRVLLSELSRLNSHSGLAGHARAGLGRDDGLLLLFP